jgi:hypothetical protein
VSTANVVSLDWLQSTATTCGAFQLKCRDLDIDHRPLVRWLTRPSARPAQRCYLTPLPLRVPACFIGCFLAPLFRTEQHKNWHEQQQAARYPHDQPGELLVSQG